MIVVTLIFSAAEAWSLNLYYTEIQVGGNFDYEFTLENDLGTQIFELWLRLPIPSTDLIPPFSSPPGWGDGSGGDQPYYGPVLPNTSFVEWWAMLGSELENGLSLNGFDFVSSSQISDPIVFSVNGDWTIAGVASLPPSSVPEPCSLLLLGSGLIGLAGYGRKKFSKN